MVSFILQLLYNTEKNSGTQTGGWVGPSLPVKTVWWYVTDIQKEPIIMGVHHIWNKCHYNEYSLHVTELLNGKN
jgi:hypothetical protein